MRIILITGLALGLFAASCGNNANNRDDQRIVIDKDKKAVVPDVKVKLVDLDVETLTDEDGKFAFLDVPPGQHMVELSSKELVTIKTEEVITKGKKKSVKYTVNLTGSVLFMDE